MKDRLVWISMIVNSIEGTKSGNSYQFKPTQFELYWYFPIKH